MTARFLPVLLPLIVVAIFAAVSYSFWKIDTVGHEMEKLPPIELGGEMVSLLRPRGLFPSHPDFRWRISVSPSSLAKLGGLDVGYGRESEEPLPDCWEPVPTGISIGAFQVSPKLPSGVPAAELVLWLRAPAIKDRVPVLRSGSWRGFAAE